MTTLYRSFSRQTWPALCPELESIAYKLRRFWETVDRAEAECDQLNRQLDARRQEHQDYLREHHVLSQMQKRDNRSQGDPGLPP